MKFYKELSTGDWILKGITTSKGIYNMEKEMVGDDEYVRITKNADVNPYFYGLVSEVTKENGDAYPDYETLKDAVKDFFVDAPYTSVYGEIYGANNLGTSIIPTGTSWTKATPFNANGLSNDAIVDHTTDSITIKIPGVYIVSAVFSTAINVNNTTLDTAVFKNGVECPNLHGERLIVNSNYISVNGLSGIVRCNAGDVLDVRCKHNAGGNVTLSTKYSCLSIKYIGG